MIHLIGNEENIANHGKLQKKPGGPPVTVLAQSRNHNLQSSTSTTLRKSKITSCRPGQGFQGTIRLKKSGVTSCKPGHACTPLESTKKMTSCELTSGHGRNSECEGIATLQKRLKSGSGHNLDSDCQGNKDLHGKQESASHVKVSRRNSDVCPIVETRAQKNKEPSLLPEVEELKQKLQDSNLRLAEVVAQSVILVQDIQSAASKEIADILSRAHTLNVESSQSRNPVTGLQQGFSLPFSTRSHGDLVDTPERDFLPIFPDNDDAMDATHQRSLSTSPSLSSNFHRATAEEELISTRQELTFCRLMLAKMKKQLKQTTLEKERLECSLRSSVQTSLQLQEKLIDQQNIMHLESLEFKEACHNVEVDCLVESARIGAEQCHRDSVNIEALPMICEAESMPGKCLQMLGGTQRESQSGTPAADKHNLESELQPPNLQQEDQEYFAEARAQVMFEWTVLECVWEGAVQSLVFSINFPYEADHKPSILPNMTSQCYTPKWSLSEELTPMKCSNMTTPRYRECVSERFSSTGTFPSGEMEAVLRENLVKSERRVEILSDNFEELKIVLEKVTALLHYISQSCVGNEIQLLLRRIIEELKSVELEFPVIPTMLGF